MTSPDEARRLYLELEANSNTVGAYNFTSAEEETRFHFQERLTCTNADCVVVEDEDAGDRASHLLIQAPSPWHAVIHLLVENRGWLSGRYGFGQQMALIYRGQASTRWQIIPSLHRPGVQFEEERDAIYSFVNLVERFYRRQMFTNFASTPSLSYLSDDKLVPKVLHVATGQHYGLRTPLLDFTTDPAVAVWFACQPNNQASAQEAAVFAIPSEIAAGVGAAILVPHPYVRRLYRQRGIFVQPPGGDQDYLKPLCVEVRFPTDSSFKVMRGDRAVDLLHTEESTEGDTWWMEQVRIARAIALEGKVNELLATPMTSEGDLAVAKMTDQWDFLPEWLMLESRQRIVGDSIEDLLHILLCMTTAMEGSQPRVADSAMRLLAAHSAFSVGTMMPFLCEYVDNLPGTAPLRIAAEPMLNGLRRVVQN